MKKRGEKAGPEVQPPTTQSPGARGPRPWESEKWLETYLTKLVKARGGISLKFASHTQTGYPDRLLLLPGGKTGWVELKSYGKHPTSLQCHRILKLREMGQRVWVCDRPEQVEAAVRELWEG